MTIPIFGKAIILGVLSAMLVILLALAVSVYYDDTYFNKINHTETITVEGKICGADRYGSNVSEIQSEKGDTYFVDFDTCMNLSHGDTKTITYNDIRQGSNEYFRFNRIVQVEDVP